MTSYLLCAKESVAVFPNQLVEVPVIPIKRELCSDFWVVETDAKLLDRGAFIIVSGTDGLKVKVFNVSNLILQIPKDTVLGYLKVLEENKEDEIRQDRSQRKSK